jgi:hypothetical protein
MVQLFPAKSLTPNGNRPIKGGMVDTVYACAKAKSSGAVACKYHGVYECELVGVAAGFILVDVLDNRAAFEEDLRRRLLESARSDPGKLNAARKELAALEAKIANGNEAFLEAPAHRRPALTARLDAWEGARDALVKKVEALERSAQEVKDIGATTRAVSEALDGLEAALLTGDRAVRRALFKRVYEYIKVGWIGEPTKRGVRPEPEFRIKVREDAFTVGTLTGELAALLQLHLPHSKAACGC